MPDFMMSWFGNEGFMPHGHCFLWTPSLLWTFVVSDALIVLSYYSIPLGLLYFVGKRKDLQFNWIFKLFSVFIFACGTTHLLAIWTIWHPDYWLDAGAKAITALVSLISAILLWPLIPRAVRLPSASQLEQTVAQLEQEIEERKAIEAELSRLKNLSEDRFHSIFNQFAVGIVEVDATTRRILRANNKYCEIVGYGEDELMQANSSPITFADDLQADLDSLQALRDGQIREFTLEKRYRRKDGSTIWVNVNVSPLWNIGDPPGAYIAIVQDISARKLAEQSLQQQLDELRRWHEVTLGREERILELKREVNQLLVRVGEPLRYASVESNKDGGNLPAAPKT
ncbi:MAG: PAS domain S-box protein [Sterolibacterium sp.]